MSGTDTDRLKICATCYWLSEPHEHGHADYESPWCFKVCPADDMYFGLALEFTVGPEEARALGWDGEGDEDYVHPAVDRHDACHCHPSQWRAYWETDAVLARRVRRPSVS